MERLVITMLGEEKNAVKALARVEQRTMPGMARWLILKALRDMGLYSEEKEQRAKQAALERITLEIACEEGNGDGSGA